MKKFAAVLTSTRGRKSVFRTARAGVERPPQFVAMAFDNCTELERWKEMSRLYRRNEQGRRPRPFHLLRQRRQLHRHRQPPSSTRGRASSAALRASISAVRRTMFADASTYINDMRRRGHEIASHAVGHFDGRAWSKAEWSREFDSFKEIFANVGARSTVFPAVSIFRLRDVNRFPRALSCQKSEPVRGLGGESAFATTPAAIPMPDEWPAKKDGIWRFNLVGLRVHGSRPRDLVDGLQFSRRAIDGFQQSAPPRAIPRADAADLSRLFQDQLQRQPRAAAYRPSLLRLSGRRQSEALKAFARMVCGLPEVHCTTYENTRRLHGQARCGDACGLSRRRFSACGCAENRRGGVLHGRAGRREDRGSARQERATPRPPCRNSRHYPADCTFPASQPSIARLRVSPQ